MAGRKHDTPWTKIRLEYITAQPKLTYKVLGFKYDISWRRVAEVGAKEGWVQARKDYWEEIEKKSLQKSAEEIAKQVAEMNVRHIQTAKELLMAGRGRMITLLDKATKAKGRLGEDDLPSGQAMRAIELGVKIERLALGEATEIEERKERPSSVKDMTDDELEAAAGASGVSEEGTRKA